MYHLGRHLSNREGEIAICMRVVYIKSMRSLLKPVDQLSLLFITLLFVGTGLTDLPLASRLRLLGTYGLIVFAIFSLAFYQTRLRTEKLRFFLHILLTVVTILLIFNSLGDLIPGLRHRTFDEMLVKIDYFLFGAHPTIWLEQFITPTRTAIFQIAYSSYYFIPLSLGIVLIINAKFTVFDETLFGIVLCFYLSYLGYLLVPAIGPRFTLDHLQNSGLQAGPWITMIQETLDGLEHNKTDAFPSGHVAVALVTLFYAWRSREKLLFKMLLPLVSTLIVSTVYLRYHYVVDVMAGVLLAGFTVALAPTAYRALLGSGMPSHQEGHGSSRNDGD
jgi:membrane-associated phospholipid phosphatase